MNSFVSFILGAVVGAVVALLYAPQSGEELRAHLRQEAEVERQRLQAQFEKGMEELQGRIDKVTADIQTLIEQSEEGKEETTDTTAEAA